MRRNRSAGRCCRSIMTGSGRDGGLVVRMERSEIRDALTVSMPFPDYAALHPGYSALHRGHAGYARFNRISRNCMVNVQLKSILAVNMAGLRDPQIRRPLHYWLQRKFSSHGDTEILHELKMSRPSGRVDVAVINGRLCGFEIKSDFDSLSRLPRQVRAFSAICFQEWNTYPWPNRPSIWSRVFWACCRKKKQTRSAKNLEKPKRP